MENLVSLASLSSFYQGKRVFITGHTGFKGSWLLSTLSLMGAEVKGYSLAPEYDGLFALLPKSGFDNTIADVRDRENLKTHLSSFQPDLIFHLAAQPLVRRSYKQPSETFDINVVGTANLLEAVQPLKKQCSIIIITTDKVYENREQDVLYSETDMLGGYDPYSASKACAEIVVSSFRNSFFHPDQYGEHKKAITSVRAGNVIGGGDWSEDRLIPDIVRALKDKRQIEIRNPKAVRPWQHVLEPIAAYLLLGAKLDADTKRLSRPFNIGPVPEDHLSVGEMVEKCISAWGSGSWKDTSTGREPHEAGLLKLSIERIRKELGWTPRLNASKAVEWTMEWYKQPVAGQLEFTYNQIRNYFGS
jgi:CDP-glucose 4,6-dehydratase